MKRFFYCMAIFAMMLYACNHAPENSVKDIELQDLTTADQNKKEEQLISADTAGIGTNGPPKIPTLTNSNSTGWDKKIIKTASIQLQLEDYKKFNASVHNSLKQFGAYISGEEQTETDYRIENNLTIKVPAALFDDLVNSFSGDGIKIIEKNISSDDVTGQLVDTKSRMQAKIAVRDKYLELLKQAKNMNEILQVQNEINRIQEDVEAANGRINYLQHASAYSTVNLSYYQYINGSASKSEKPDFFTKMASAFSVGTSFITNLILFLISIWPLLLAGLAVLIYLKKMKLKKA